MKGIKALHIIQQTTNHLQYMNNLKKRYRDLEMEVLNRLRDKVAGTENTSRHMAAKAIRIGTADYDEIALLEGDVLMAIDHNGNHHNILSIPLEDLIEFSEPDNTLQSIVDEGIEILVELRPVDENLVRSRTNIPKEILQEALDVYESGDSVEDYLLGLNLSKEELDILLFAFDRRTINAINALVRKHGGSIELKPDSGGIYYSDDSEGTRYYFTKLMVGEVEMEYRKSDGETVIQEDWVEYEHLSEWLDEFLHIAEIYDMQEEESQQKTWERCQD